MAAGSSSGVRRPAGVLAAVSGVCALVVLAAFVVGHVDASALKPRVEAGFERATGRSLHIGGTLRLGLLPSPGFVADDVSIANLPGGTRPDMVTARRISARIDLFDLFARSVNVRSLSLVDPDILLEIVHGEPNWRFRPRSSGGDGKVSASSPNAKFTVHLNEVDAHGGRLAWRGLGPAGSGDVGVDRLYALQQDRSSFTLFAAGHRGDAAFTAGHRGDAAFTAGHGGDAAFTVSLASAPPAGLDARPARPIPVRAKLTLGRDRNGDHIDVDGMVTAAGGFDGRVHAVLAQLADLNGLFAHAHLPGAANLRLDAKLDRDSPGVWRVLSIDASGQQADLNLVERGLSLDRFAVSAAAPDAPLMVDGSGEFRHVPFRIKGVAGSPDLVLRHAAEGPIDLAGSIATDTLSLRGRLSDRDGTIGVAGRAALNVPDPASLRPVVGTIAVPALAESGDLRLSARRGGFDAALDGSKLSIGSDDLPVSRLTASLAGPGQLVVQAASSEGTAPWLTWREDLASSPHRVELRLDGHDLPAAAVSALFAGRAIVGGRLTVRATIDGNAAGSGLDEGTITGPISATLRDADLDSAVVRDLIGHVLRAAHLPKLGGAAARIDCTAGSGNFGSGSLALATLSLDSPFLTMTGSGNIGLRHGSLDLHVKPVLRLGAADVATQVLLAGTIDNPTAALEAQSDGRFGVRIGRASNDVSSPCGGSEPAKRKPPKPADFLRALGILH